MHDIFDKKLEAEAAKRGLERVEATWAAKPHEAKGFTIATSTEQWVYKKGVDALANLELDPRRDSLHHRSSGLDSTSAKMCARAEVLVAINLENLRTLDPVIIGRVMQNIELCRQHKAQMCVFSKAKKADELPHEPDVRGLLETLGMSPGEAKRTCENLERAYKKRQQAK